MCENKMNKFNIFYEIKKKKMKLKAVHYLLN